MSTSYVAYMSYKCHHCMGALCAPFVYFLVGGFYCPFHTPCTLLHTQVYQRWQEMPEHHPQFKYPCSDISACIVGYS
ncbi:hypothetical protein DL89DRAFT_91520 [Linderina pennispora]|uniref:Uncharacterized protein n=1 Tax=Linderina pennispora TaxID=61395 RepID=A0A1Y1WJD5_9FUNG|nr:uncharacterized protein DL89DRAFT_91520 [Linderina pennispora]ORX73336.1 hypothetical protein DL89DRAFT_91520 [Linderina pennispora]